MKNSVTENLAYAFMALVFGFLGAALWSFFGLADNRTRDYLISNPDILPLMAEAYQEQEASERLAQIRDEAVSQFGAAVLGNPDGTRVLVEFTDYNCPYCEASFGDVERLVAENPDLKVIMREWPIFEGSEPAARIALAAALQGKYDAFHRAMFANAPTTPENIEKAAKEAGLDWEKAQQDAMSDPISIEIAQNMAIAQQLGFTGTPAWIAGNRAINGAVGYEALAEAVSEAAPEAETEAEQGA